MSNSVQKPLPQRQSIHPQTDDTWHSIAQRELSGESLEQAVASLQSWNLHVFARRVIDEATGEMGNPILPSDIVFLEPPLTTFE